MLCEKPKKKYFFMSNILKKYNFKGKFKKIELYFCDKMKDILLTQISQTSLLLQCLPLLRLKLLLL